jgi:hypothetical protein
MINDEKVKQATRIMTEIGWRSDGLTEHCIRTIMDQMDVSQRVAGRLYGAVAERGVARQEQEARNEKMDPKQWGATYGIMPTLYNRWVMVKGK